MAALLSDVSFDCAFASTLMRAQATLNEVLKLNRHCTGYQYRTSDRSDQYESFSSTSDDETTLQVHVTASLNERYYGELQGINKDWAKRHYGAEQVHCWRRSYRAVPPHGESLEMTAARTLPYYQDKIVPQLQADKCVLICAHGNSLRSIIMFIEQLTPEQVVDRELETGVPLRYTFDANMRVVEKNQSRRKSTQA